MVKNKTKPKPRGRPQVSTLKRLTKSVTVKFSKPDYEMLRRRSKNAIARLPSTYESQPLMHKS